MPCVLQAIWIDVVSDVHREFAIDVEGDAGFDQKAVRPGRMGKNEGVARAMRGNFRRDLNAAPRRKVENAFDNAETDGVCTRPQGEECQPNQAAPKRYMITEKTPDIKDNFSIIAVQEGF